MRKIENFCSYVGDVCPCYGGKGKCSVQTQYACGGLGLKDLEIEEDEIKKEKA